MSIIFFKYALPILLGYTLFVGISGRYMPFRRPRALNRRPAWFLGSWTGLSVAVITMAGLQLAYQMNINDLGNLLTPAALVLGATLLPGIMFYAAYKLRTKRQIKAIGAKYIADNPVREINTDIASYSMDDTIAHNTLVGVDSQELLVSDISSNNDFSTASDIYTDADVSTASDIPATLEMDETLKLEPLNIIGIDEHESKWSELSDAAEKMTNQDETQLFNIDAISFDEPALFDIEHSKEVAMEAEVDAVIETELETEAEAEAEAEVHAVIETELETETETETETEAEAEAEAEAEDDAAAETELSANVNAEFEAAAEAQAEAQALALAETTAEAQAAAEAEAEVRAEAQVEAAAIAEAEAEAKFHAEVKTAVEAEALSVSVEDLASEEAAHASTKFELDKAKEALAEVHARETANSEQAQIELEKLRMALTEESHARKELETHLRITRKGLAELDAESRDYEAQKAIALTQLEKELEANVKRTAAAEARAERESAKRSSLEIEIVNLRQDTLKATKESRESVEARARALSTANKATTFARQAMQARTRLETQLQEAEEELHTKRETISSLIKSLEKEKARTQEEVGSKAKQLILHEKQLQARRTLEEVSRSVDNKLGSRLVKKIAKAKG